VTLNHNAGLQVLMQPCLTFICLQSWPSVRVGYY